MVTSEMTPADIRACTDNNGGGWGGDWSSWIIIFLIFAAFGGYGGGGFGGYGGGAAQNYVLNSDFATIQRQLSDGFNGIDNALDRQNAGICDLGYTQLSLANNIGTNIMQTGNAIQTQLADCCCKTQSGIERINTNNAMNTATITGAIKDCCCDTEKMFMQSRFDAQTYNCDTLRAIDKLGDRIIGYMADDKAQALRDENQALRLAASQAAQNNTIISALRPMPIPAYPSCNPWAASYGTTCNGGWMA